MSENRSPDLDFAANSGTGMFLSILLKENPRLRGLAELPGVTPPSRVKPRAFPRKEKLPESGVAAFLHLESPTARPTHSFHI